MRPIRLHNTLTGRVDELTPERPPEVRMYVCGLTVYGRGHIGNFRTLVSTDLLRRTLKYKGYKVVEVMNVTDVDDKIIKLAAEAGSDIQTFTAPHVQAFEEDLRTLRMERPEHVPHATAHIEEMTRLIERLIQNDHTYTADGSVYFRIASFPSYGRLSRLDASGIKAGARVDSDEYAKENARDFVLWKLKSDEPAWAQWDAPFGKGRPGWHIECSAMAMKYLGEGFDIHCGGVDLVFPHHENEIAQSEGATGKPFVRHWVHTQHLMVESEKMAKSKGNFFTIPDLLARGASAEAIRYLLLSAQYRTALNFTQDGLSQAQAALDRIHSFVRRLSEVEKDGPVSDGVGRMVEKARMDFDTALADDLNTPEALAAVHEVVHQANVVLAAGTLTRAEAALLSGLMNEMNSVFAVFVPETEDQMTAAERAEFDIRETARKARDFARADEARKRLEAMGIVLEDTPKGTRWRRKH
jgi:cysteinyl-tRNA synthetase